MAITESFTGIPVRDFTLLVAWYEGLLGRPPDFFPHAFEAIWHLTEHAWIYVVLDAERAGTALLTLLVDDLEVHLAHLAERRMPVVRDEILAGAMRKVTISDPEGNQIAFGQPGESPTSGG